MPWLLKFGATAALGRPYRPISVESKGLICSLGMLFVMLLVMYAAVAWCRWRMSRRFGFTMLASYALFCLLSILLELDVVLCPLRRLSHHC